MRQNKGITLIEIIIYVALLGGIAVFVSNTLLHISDVYGHARKEREVTANARLILETLSQTIHEAESVYGPTSVFLSDSGQLSLITSVNTPAEHQTAYVDFYVDNGRFWTKKDGMTATPLSASTVRVTRLRLERIMQGLEREAVKITLEITSQSSKRPISIVLNTTATLSGNY